MAQGGSIKEQIKRLDEQIDEMGREFMKENLPGPKVLYRMNQDEFMHHIHVFALQRLLMDKLGVTMDEIDLYMKREFLEEGRKVLEAAKRQKSQAMRSMLTDGIVLPPDPQI